MHFLRRFQNWRKRPASEKLHSFKYHYRSLRLSLLNRISAPSTIRARLPWGTMMVGNDWLGRNIYIGSYEKKEMSLISSLARPGWNYLDIGANIGYYSVFFSKALKSASVLAFEPSPRELERLQQNLRLNNCTNVKVFPLALGKEQAVLNLHLSENNFGKNTFFSDDVTDRIVPVPVRPLDDVLDEHPGFQVDFVKMDVEGAEPMVLQGASRLIAIQKPVFLYETWAYEKAPYDPASCEATNILNLAGYRFFFADETHHLIPAVIGRVYHESNIIAIHASRTGEFTSLIRSAAN